jgi:hypothetical protein
MYSLETYLLGVAGLASERARFNSQKI